MGLKEKIVRLVKKVRPAVVDVRNKAKPVAEKVKRFGKEHGLYNPNGGSLRVPRSVFSRPDPLFGDLRWYRHQRGRPPGKKKKKKRRSWGSRNS